MNLPVSWLADLDLSQLPPNWRRTPPLSRETALVIAATVGVGLLALLWAVFLRKRRRGRGKRHHSQPAPAPVPTAPKIDSSSHSRREKHRRRRRRRDHRPRNPTLSQTGGLPPIRSDGPSDPVP